MTNYPQFLWLKTTNIYDATVSGSQEFGSGLIGWFWPRIAHKAAVEPLAGAAVSSEVSTDGVSFTLPRWLLTGLRSLLAGDFSVAFPVGISTECLNVPKNGS